MVVFTGKLGIITGPSVILRQVPICTVPVRSFYLPTYLLRSPLFLLDTLCFLLAFHDISCP
jgi:hypothetical protein